MKKIVYILGKLILIIALVLLFSLGIYMIVFPFIKKNNQANIPTVITNTGSTTTGGEQVTIDSGQVLPQDKIPTDPRAYVDYILKNGKAGEDYIIVEPTIPPIIRSSDKQDNNAIMYSYVSKHSNQFTIPQGKTDGYVMFTTKREIPNTRDFFLAIDGNIRGHIMRNSSLPVYNDNEYLYGIRSINVLQKEGSIVNLLTSVRNNKLLMTAFVGEQGNYVTNITIVFK